MSQRVTDETEVGGYGTRDERYKVIGEGVLAQAEHLNKNQERSNTEQMSRGIPSYNSCGDEGYDMTHVCHRSETDMSRNNNMKEEIGSKPKEESKGGESGKSKGGKSQNQKMN